MTVQRTKNVALIISESGLQSLMAAGVSTAWVKAWLLSAGATDVSLALLESDGWESDFWHDAKADWLLFFAREDELEIVMQQHGVGESSESTCLMLDNPPRNCLHYSNNGKRVVLLPVGDIAYQRNLWLSLFNDRKPLLPLYVRADDTLPISLEPGLSAAISEPSDDCLNASGLLIEEQVIASLKQRRLLIRTVESCTAGGIAARLCRVPGASEVVDRAWVTYSNNAKQEEMGVAATLLEQHGAVSEAVIRAMAEGGADAAHVCVAVSGIAGPGGGTVVKPVGTVWIAFAMAGHGTVSQCVNLPGARYEIQSRTVIAALNFLLTEVE